MTLLIEAEYAVDKISRLIDSYLVKSDFDGFGRELSRWCVTYCKENGIIQPEKYISIMSLALAAWSSFILESKGISHYKQPSLGWRDFLEKMYIPSMKSIILDSRNLAIEIKKGEQESGHPNVPLTIHIPEYYIHFDDEYTCA